MKKILYVLLTALLLIGVFAIGASASAPVFVQEEDEYIAEKIEAIKKEVDIESRYWVSPGILAFREWFDTLNKYKHDKTEQGLEDALSEVMADVEGTAEYEALCAFLDNDVALKAAYAEGTLRDKLITLHTAVYNLLAAGCKKIAIEFFVPEVLAIAEELSKIFKLSLVFENAELTQEKRAEMEEKAKNNTIISNLERNHDNALKAGNFEAALQNAKNVLKEYKQILAEYGILPTYLRYCLPAVGYTMLLAPVCYGLTYWIIKRTSRKQRAVYAK